MSHNSICNWYSGVFFGFFFDKLKTDEQYFLLSQFHEIVLTHSVRFMLIFAGRNTIAIYIGIFQETAGRNLDALDQTENCQELVFVSDTFISCEHQSTQNVITLLS